MKTYVGPITTISFWRGDGGKQSALRMVLKKDGGFGVKLQKSAFKDYHDLRIYGA